MVPAKRVPRGESVMERAPGTLSAQTAMRKPGGSLIASSLSPRSAELPGKKHAAASTSAPAAARHALPPCRPSPRIGPILPGIPAESRRWAAPLPRQRPARGGYSHAGTGGDGMTTAVLETAEALRKYVWGAPAFAALLYPLALAAM